MRKLFGTILCSVFVSLSFGQDMVKVEGGAFMMGSNDLSDNAGNVSSKPPHSVTLGSFSISKYEITWEKWMEVSAWGLLHGYGDLGEAQNGAGPEGSNNPVTTMIWYDAVKWCNARSEKEGLTPVYYTSNALTTVYRSGRIMLTSSCMKWSANGYRLPTEAEWEFAARGGMKSKNYTYSGSNTLEDVGWVKTNSGPTIYTSHTHTVGGKAANELGLFDMSGNVSEWVSDMSGVYSDAAQTDPKGPDSNGSYRIGRGGSFNNNYTNRLRIAFAAGILSGDLGFRCAISGHLLTIISPSNHEVLLADSPYIIKWNSSGIDSIKIEYSIDDGKTFQKITSGIPASTGSIVWKVPKALSGKCKLVLTNIHDPLDMAVLSNFHIKGYDLTRFKANGDYELFDPALHAWQFDNSGPNMWPEEWYLEFNYDFSANGKDPYTNKRYPVKFNRTPILAFPNNFIDWPLFVKTFRQSVCYKDISKAEYSPTALKLWCRYRDENWMGSCFGFSQSCLLAFDRPAAFLAAFPEVGNFKNIHDLTINNSLRLVINQLYEGQYGRQHKLFSIAQIHAKDVRKSLAELRSYFLSDSVDHRALSIYSASGAHSIVPYRLENLSGYPGQFVVWCYDNQNPSGIGKNGSPTAVVLDSIHNQWAYAPFNWQRSDGLGVCLNDPASTYLEYPELWSVLKSAGIFGKSSGASAYLDFYNTISSNISITNPAGQSIGFAEGGTYNNLGDGIPIMPQNSANQPPIGYFIPEDKYSIRMNSFTDSLVVFSVLNQTAMFNYWRSDAVKNQTDLLVYDGGMGFRNPDAQTKSINLEVINRLADCESDFQILNFTVGTNDSVRLESLHFDRVALVNPGPAKTYDLNIVQACTSLAGEFNYHRITVPAHSTHFIVPDLQNLLNHPVKIYVDKGNTGIISDSLFFSNQVTGIKNQINTGNGGKFSLDQNYPNPFHTTTTIGFHIAEPGYVSLKVFDVVGAEVAILLNGQKPAGDYSIDWNAAGLRSGIYFCQLQSGGCIGVKKMLLK